MFPVSPDASAIAVSPAGTSRLHSGLPVTQPLQADDQRCMAEAQILTQLVRQTDRQTD